MRKENPLRKQMSLHKHFNIPFLFCQTICILFFFLCLYPKYIFFNYTEKKTYSTTYQRCAHRTGPHEQTQHQSRTEPLYSPYTDPYTAPIQPLYRPIYSPYTDPYTAPIQTHIQLLQRPIYSPYTDPHRRLEQNEADISGERVEDHAQWGRWCVNQHLRKTAAYQTTSHITQKQLMDKLTILKV